MDDGPQLLDLRVVPVLTGVGDGPAAAAREWEGLAIASRLAAFDPVVVSSLANGLGVDGSDLDVVCDLRAPGLLDAVREAYGARPQFATWTSGARTMASWAGEHLHVELVGEPRPVEEQPAYVHAVAQRRLVETGGAEFAARVRALRARTGMKTEPALATVLRLTGDPYEDLADLATAPTPVLRGLVDRALR